MGLLNYTTEIAPEKSIGEITTMLVRAKAQAILTEFDGAGNAKAISFKIGTQFGVMSFCLPCNIAAVALVMNAQAKARNIPGKYLNDVTQARRVGWRIIRQWIEAQLALVEVGNVKLEQVFLPYAQNANGVTMYDALVEQKFSSLMLEAPKQ